MNAPLFDFVVLEPGSIEISNFVVQVIVDSHISEICHIQVIKDNLLR